MSLIINGDKLVVFHNNNVARMTPSSLSKETLSKMSKSFNVTVFNNTNSLGLKAKKLDLSLFESFLDKNNEFRIKKHQYEDMTEDGIFISKDVVIEYVDALRKLKKGDVSRPDVHNISSWMQGSASTPTPPVVVAVPAHCGSFGSQKVDVFGNTHTSFGHPEYRARFIMQYGMTPEQWQMNAMAGLI